MAPVSRHPMTRRTFLSLTCAAAATGLAGDAPRSAGEPAGSPAETRWALLSDTHISQDPANEYRGFRPRDTLERAVAAIAAAKTDGAIVTGDLARLEGLPGDYAALKELVDGLAAAMPVGLALGNHDNRTNFLAAFPVLPGERPSVGGKVVQILRRGPVRFILLDSLFYVNKAEGLLGKRQRDWLAAYLQGADETPTILCVHHTLDDGDGSLLDSDRLLRIAAAARQVKAIVYGHSHVYGFTTHEGIHLINLPATGYNFSDAQPVGWVEARLTAKGGDFTLHAVGGDASRDGVAMSFTWRR